MAEEFRDEEKFVLMADVPGLDPDRDILVSVASDVLHVRAERSDGAGVPNSDLREGLFTRDIRLPAGTDEWNLSANYTDGVLEIRAPMLKSRSASRVIPVTLARDQKGVA
jgi:HSP20 family molecular chaperone IbpA